jgi:hypothetical protein
MVPAGAPTFTCRYKVPLESNIPLAVIQSISEMQENPGNIPPPYFSMVPLGYSLNFTLGRPIKFEY